MNSIMVALTPKQCKLIEEGKQTALAFKTGPKLEPPFRVYMYCKKTRILGELLVRNGELVAQNRGFRETGDVPAAGKVIGEFICNRTQHYSTASYKDAATTSDKEVEKCIRLTYSELMQYESDCSFFIIKVTSPQFYLQPKELNNFRKPYSYDSEGFVICPHSFCPFIDNDGHYKFKCDNCPSLLNSLTITRAPAPWIYCTVI